MPAPVQSPMQSPGQSTATQQVGIERRAPVPLTVYLEGIRAGLVGASIIAVWFLLVDTIAGHPFYTPAVLGQALFHGEASIQGGAPIEPSLELVAGFTWVHYLVFLLIGVGAARLMALAERNPNLGFGIVLFFAVFEFGFLLASMIFADSVMQRLAWPAVVIGNLLAAIGMCWVLWRAHRQLAIQP
jgi:hypothetical protein